MKTKLYPIPVLLAGLPKGIAEKAVKNCDRDSIYGDDVVSELRADTCSAVWGGFFWEDSPEGSIYWYKIEEQLKSLGL